MRNTLASLYRDGEEVDNRYRIVRHITSTLTSEVYEATLMRPGDELTVALKVLPIQYFRLMNKESDTLREVHSEYVVKFVDQHWSTTNKLGFVATEYLNGNTLDEKISGSPIRPAHAASLMLNILAGLSVLHSKVGPHRDIKPKNIMIVPHADGERAVIIDFGIAIKKGETIDTPIGTKLYAAPEQFESPSRADIRMDIFSCGLVLYEMLTGHSFREKWNGDDTQRLIVTTLKDACASGGLSVEEKRIHDALNEVVNISLNHNPDDRYQDAEAMAQAIKDAVASSGSRSEEDTKVIGPSSGQNNNGSSEETDRLQDDIGYGRPYSYPPQLNLPDLPTDPTIEIPCPEGYAILEGMDQVVYTRRNLWLIERIDKTASEKVLEVFKKSPLVGTYLKWRGILDQEVKACLEEAGSFQITEQESSAVSQGRDVKGLAWHIDSHLKKVRRLAVMRAKRIERDLIRAVPKVVILVAAGAVVIPLLLMAL